MTHQLPRRKALVLIAAATFSTAAPSLAQKKRPRRNYRRPDYSTPVQTPRPTSAPTPQPEKYSPPHPALMPSVAGGILGLFGLVGAWFWKMNQ